jgi:chromosome segregation ATPase
MITEPHDGARGLDITELPTDEYPILSEAALAVAHAASDSNGRGGVVTGPEPVRAALSLTHLEAEVARLHAKWRDIDAEFEQREALAAQLREEIRAREHTIAKLTSEVELGKVACNAAGEQLARKDAELAALIREQRTRDDKLEALTHKLAEAESAHNEVLEQLTSAAAETARLNGVVAREQTASFSLGERNREILTEYQALQSKLQDLEIYINGRHDRWADLNAELASLKEALRAKDEAIEARAAIIASHDEEKRQLTAAIHDLERQCAELAGRRKEREEAHDELQQKLASHLAQAEQLKSEHARKAKETELALERVDDAAKQLAERDEQIRALRSELHGAQDQQRLAQEHANELAKLHAAAAADAKQLQAALGARNELVAKLESELRAKQSTVDMLERSVGRIADLGASLAALDERMHGAAPKHATALPAPQAADIVDIGEPADTEVWRKLVVTMGDRTVDYPISKGQMTIGRGHESDIRVASHFISRVHARIKTNGSATIIEDAGSKNGVLVNSERVLRRVLRNGDIVMLGDELCMRFVDATH